MTKQSALAGNTSDVIRDLQERVAQLEADYKTIWDQLIAIIGRLPAKAANTQT